MRMTKRLIAFVLVAVMLVSTCIMAAAFPSSPTYTTPSGVSYYNYSLTGSSSGKTSEVNVLKFNTGDGFIPLAYSGDVGKTASVEQHVAAAQAEGYEVVGAINASFFGLSTGDPCSSLITNGKLMFGSAGHEDIFMTFDINGKPTLTQVTLAYTMTLDGVQIDNAVGLVNKDYTAYSDVKANSGVDISGRFHYFDSSAGAINKDTSTTGYEILCEKQNGTDIKVGTMLEGKVISVTSGYYGKTIPTNKNQFVLFVKYSGTHASKAAALSAGDKVTLYIDAWSNGSRNDWATTLLRDCHSAICDTYWLVKDGTNIAATTATIGHSTTLSRPWTAFGWDNNGNYYYYISEGEKLTLRDAAAEMIKMGCTNVVRLDGGGSTAMWVEGKNTVYDQGRLVVDALLIIKTPANITLEQTLAEAKALYVGDYSAEANAYLNQAYDKAFDVYKKANATNAEYRKADTDLKNAMAYIKNANNFAGKEKLSDFLFVTAVNEKIPTGGASIFTTAYNGGVIKRSDAGFGFCYNLICDRQSDGTYKVIEQINKPGFSAEDIVLTGNQILISVNKSTTASSKLNGETAERCGVGSVLKLYGMAIEYNYISAGAYVDCVSIVESDDGSTTPDTDPDTDPDTNPDPEPVNGIKGDVNMNGKIDARDYLLLKRAFFKTFTLQCSDEIADINDNGKIDARDYLLLKRAFFKTYEIK